MKKRKTTTEILNKIDEKVNHFKKLDEIRAERNKLDTSSIVSKMKEENKVNGEIKQND